MKDYISYLDIFDTLAIKKGGIIFVSSDISAIGVQALRNGEKFEVQLFIDSLIKKVGSQATILFPTYNWAFCRGEVYDQRNAKCETGILGRDALKRNDFKRTKHPIYSFAVYGKEQERLCKYDNKSSFGEDSPFGFMYHNNATSLSIGIKYSRFFTLVHYVEQKIGNVPYRYLKEFKGEYIDEEGVSSIKKYDMYVRNLELQTKVDLSGLDRELDNLSIVETINDVKFRLIEFKDAYEVFKKDIIFNNSKNICTYVGQK